MKRLGTTGWTTAIAGGIACLLGAVVLVGWITRHVEFIQVSPTTVPMQFNTALSFLLLGTALAGESMRWGRPARLLGILSGFISVATLVQYGLHIDLGLDQLFMESYVSTGAWAPGRMAPNTALAFLLASVALITASDWQDRPRRTVVPALFGSVVAALGTVSAFGYAGGIPSAYGWGDLTPMAPQTAAGMMILGGGLVALSWRLGNPEGGGGPKWLPALAGVGAAVIAVCMWRALVVRRDADLRRTAALAAQSAKHAVEEGITTRVLALERMAERWANRGGVPRAEWDADASRYVSDYSGFQAIEWADSSLRVGWAVPATGNEMAVGLELGANPTRRVVLERAAREHRSLLSRTRPLLQGGRGLRVYVPIMKGDRFMGFIIGVFRADALFRGLLDPVLGHTYAATLLEYGVPVYLGGATHDPASRSRVIAHERVEAYGASWGVRLEPAAGAPSGSSLPEVSLVIGLLTAVLLAWSTQLGQDSWRRARSLESANLSLQQEMVRRAQAEEGFRASQERFSTLATLAPVGIFQTDAFGKCLFVNRAWCQMTGLGPLEAAGTGWTAALHPDDRTRVVEQWRKAAGLGTRFQADYRFRLADGSDVWVQGSADPVRGTRGEVTGFLGSVTDITERRRAAEALQASETRFRALAGSTYEAIVSNDAGGRIIFWNQAAERIFGYSEAEVVGQPLTRIIPERYWDAHERRLAQFASTGEMRFLGRTIEMEGLRKDGSEVPIELSLSTWVAGGDRFFTGVLRDISERKRAEETLQRLASIVQSSEDAIITMTLDGIIQTWNPGAEHLYGYSAADAIGQQVTLLHPPGTAHSGEQLFAQITEGERVNQLETVNLTKDGRLLEVALTISPIRDRSGGVVGVASIARDITEWKALERMKDEFIGTVSHELRTPLTAIKGFIELVADGDAGPVTDRQREFLDITARNTDRLGALINDLLDVNQLGSRNLRIASKPVDFAAVLEDVTATFRVSAETKGLELRSEIGPMPTILGDRDRLFQIFSNLISNAIKYTPRGVVGVRTRLVERAIETTVYDTGIGITDEDQKSLFTKFFRSQDPVVLEAGGTGLGLVIVKAIVERLDGRIEVDSRPGSGTSFTVIFPALPAGDVQSAAAA